MINESVFPHPQPSFPFPVDLVTAEPSADPLVCVKFNAHYLPYILGALLQLALRSTWDASTDDAAQQQLLRINDLIYLFQQASDECALAPVSHIYEEMSDMPAFRVDCDCNVFVVCCDGTEIMLAKASDVPKSATPSDTNPQPTPGGGTAKYCQRLDAQGKLLIPTLVSTGDVIHLQSATGAGNDGSEPAWRCVDGSQFFGGACVGFPHTDGADPLPATSHMALIVNVAGTFHAFASGSVTVPAGVASAEAYIQVNDSTLLGNLGSYDVCVQVTNNQDATWEHVFDFLVSNGGWAVNSDDRGVWTPGAGWYGSNAGSNDQSEVEIVIALPSSRTVTYFEVQCSKAVGSGTDNEDIAGLHNDSDPVFWAIIGASTVGTNIVHTWTGTQLTDSLFIDHDSGTGAGPVIIKKCIVRGIGTNPFLV